MAHLEKSDRQHTVYHPFQKEKSHVFATIISSHWLLSSYMSDVLSGSVGGHRFFFDTFDDGDAADGMPVTWVPQLGNWDASSGDYVASDPTLFAKISLVPEYIDLSDTSVRAQIRAVGNTAIGVGVRRTPGPFGYGGFLDDDGTLNIIRVDGAPSAIELVSTVVPFNAVDQDVMLQIDAIGNELSLWAWLVGDPMPDAPQLVVSDSNYPTGTVGLISAADGAPSTSIGTFRFVHVANTHIPEPSTCALVSLASVGLMGYAGRRRLSRPLFRRSPAMGELQASA